MIKLEDVCFGYDDAPGCIHNVNLHIEHGECVVLMGRSGNGKTTLTRLINGLAPAYYGGCLTGDILVGGKPLDLFESCDRAKTFGNVFQDPKSQFFSDELAGEVAFACENLGYPAAEIRSRTDRTIAEMGIDCLKNRSLGVLSSGEKQKVAIASVRVVSPWVYVFDEPSANLDEVSAQSLADAMRELKRRGHTLVIAEHRLSYLSGIADRYVYIENGRVTRDFSDDLFAGLTGQDRAVMGLREQGRHRVPILPQPGKSDFGNLLELHRVGYRTKRTEIFEDISFCACAGDIIAVTGCNGIGKTTLAKIICGLRKETAGEVLIKGKKIKARERWKDIWYSSNDINTQLFTSSVEDELLLLSRGETTIEAARTLLKGLGLYEYRGCHPSALSGGQKQRLSIACGILSGRDILIFDEPTSGLDGENLLRVARAFQNAAAAGKAILLITHDKELIEKCCTHHYALQRQQM